MELNESVVRQLRLYMLGLLPRAHEEQFENRLMEEDGFFREVDGLSQLVHDELADDYVSGALDTVERAAFERRLGRQRDVTDKVVLARALRRTARRRKSPFARIASWFRPVTRPVPALAAAFAVVLVAGAVWVTVSSRQASQEVELASGESGMRVEAERPRPSGTEAEPEQSSETEQVPSPARAPVVASYVLAPGLVRSGGDTLRIAQPEAGGTVELLLDIGLDEYPAYEAVLENADGEQIVSYDRLTGRETPETAYVAVRVLGNLLAIDDYQLRLNGINSAGESERIDRYAFRVVPR